MSANSTTSRPARFEFARACGVMLAAQLLLAGLAAQFTPAAVRPLVMAVTTIVSMMAIAAWLDLPSKRKILAIVLATIVSATGIAAWRRLVDPLAFIGAVPASLEFPALGINATLTVLFAALIAIAARPASCAYRWRWTLVSAASLIVVGSLLVLSPLRQQNSLALQLRRVMQLESQQDSLSSFDRQDLSFWLGALGRGGEAQAFSTREATTYGRAEQHENAPSELPEEALPNAVDWRAAIEEIAARERIVVIMEAHNAPQHREWIEQTLPIFHQAGFRHYAAETLAEAESALAVRGYPAQSTGAYVADPCFGNLLRRALKLGFMCHAYEAQFARDIPQREEQQAATLANILAAHPDCKIIIHAGYAHAFKKPVAGADKWMAARLWEKTGVEPFCIYQGLDQYDSPGFARLAKLAGVGGEPKILIPVPSGVADPQFADIPAGAIDALVIHPPCRSKSPASRRPVFADGMQQISGRWLEAEWPIVVGAYRTGEPLDAIALDQVMLRAGESEFELWIPPHAYELRVTSPVGMVSIAVDQNENFVEMRKASTSR